jgi:hypothetical protein
MARGDGEDEVATSSHLADSDDVNAKIARGHVALPGSRVGSAPLSTFSNLSS